MPTESSPFTRVKFGDLPHLQDTLAELIAKGIKTSTCSAYIENQEYSKVGDIQIVEDSNGIECCRIKVTNVFIKTFDEIDASFAYQEGEGDRSLEYWRKEHQRFFKNEGTYSPYMKLFCEVFKKV